MKVAIGSDHAGYNLKESLKKYLKELSFIYEDLGTFSTDPVDYPDVTLKVCQAVSKGDYERGIIICGTGIGTCIAANKVPGIRAALCHDPVSSGFSRTHNDANVLTLGERIIGPNLAQEIVRIFLTTEFTGGRHIRRVEKIKKIEEKYSVKGGKK